MLREKQTRPPHREAFPLASAPRALCLSVLAQLQVSAIRRRVHAVRAVHNHGLVAQSTEVRRLRFEKSRADLLSIWASGRVFDGHCEVPSRDSIPPAGSWVLGGQNATSISLARRRR